MDIWVQILTLAQKWGFREVASLCVRELEKLPIQPVDKICIYQRFKLDRTLLLDSFAKLTTRPEPLTLDEGGRLGLETSLQIAQARELSRGPRSGTRSSIQLQDSEVDIVRSILKLSIVVALGCVVLVTRIRMLYYVVPLSLFCISIWQSD